MKIVAPFRLALYCFVCFFTAKINAQDIIVKNDSSKIQAKILEINSINIKFKRFDYLDGPTVLLSVKEINYIKYPNGNIETFNKPIVKKDYSKQNSSTQNTGTSHPQLQNGLQPNSVPIIEPFESSSLKIYGIYKPKGEFEKLNPDFSLTGKYFYNHSFLTIGSRNYKDLGHPNGGYKRNFNYTQYPVNYITTSSDLSKIERVVVLFTGFIPLEEDKYYYQACNSKFKLNNLSEFDLSNDSKEIYQNINSKYLSIANSLLDLLKAKNRTILNILDSKFETDLSSNTYILEFKVSDLDYSFTKGDRKNWPDFIKYQLNIIGASSEVFATYNQCVFFQSDINVLSKPGKYVSEFVKSSLNFAMSSLTNQFLNDTETKKKVKLYNEKQSQSVPSGFLEEFSRNQSKLLELRLNKKMIASELELLGYTIENTSINQPMDPNRVQVYNSSASQQTNQLATQAGQMAVGLANVLEANKERKRIESLNSNIDKLKFEYEKLEVEESEYSKTINPEILNSQAVLYLPNNKDINKSVTSVLQEMEKKVENTSNSINNKSTKIKNDFNSLNSQLQSEQSSAESYASTNGGSTISSSKNNGNSQEAAICAKQSKNDWYNTPEYQQYMKNQGCNKFAYISEKKLSEIMLSKCRQYLSQAEIEGFEKTISSLSSTINGMEDCKTY